MTECKLCYLRISTYFFEGSIFYFIAEMSIASVDVFSLKIQGKDDGPRLGKALLNVQWNSESMQVRSGKQVPKGRRVIKKTTKCN